MMNRYTILISAKEYSSDREVLLIKADLMPDVIDKLIEEIYTNLLQAQKLELANPKEQL